MFKELELHPDLVRGVDRLGFVEPTPIQRNAIPPALAGRDLLACASTGTGKTAAFLLPTLQRLLAKPVRATRVLVLTPTRELAAQVEEHFQQLAGSTPLRAAAIFGGVAMGPQVKALRSRVDVLVATPGRLLDHMQYPYGRLDGVEIVILDEADRMLDMGFLPAVRRILGHLPARQQTLLFSATMPAQITSLAREMMRDPVTIDLQGQAAPATGVSQSVYPVAQERKADLLLELLARDAIGNALVFTRTKHRASRLAETLDRRGVPSAPIHGNRSQSQRTQALSGFRAGRLRVLVATDIASRGIDVENLSHVVNFDVPNTSDDYIHRVGRTARAQAVGDAFTFVSPAEEGDLRSIERSLKQRLSRVTLPEFDYASRPRDVAHSRQATAPREAPRPYGSPRSRETPRSHATPRSQEMPRPHDGARSRKTRRSHEAPRSHETPRSREASRSHEAPRSRETPRSPEALRPQEAPRSHASPAASLLFSARPQGRSFARRSPRS